MWDLKVQQNQHTSKVCRDYQKCCGEFKNCCSEIRIDSASSNTRCTLCGGDRGRLCGMQACHQRAIMITKNSRQTYGLQHMWCSIVCGIVTGGLQCASCACSMASMDIAWSSNCHRSIMHAPPASLFGARIKEANLKQRASLGANYLDCHSSTCMHCIHRYKKLRTISA